MIRYTSAFTLAVVLISCTAGSGPEGAESTPDATAPAAYLAGTDSRVITSQITGRTYQVSVAVPRGYSDAADTFPVLYALDANGEFGIVVETARLLELGGEIPPLVIVGIGYPVGYYFEAVDDRGVDLTITEDPDFATTWQERLPSFPMPPATGGASGFLRFMTEELFPLVEAEYRVATHDRSLFGHSLGGLFAAYAMLNSGGAIHRFIAASPMLSWDDRVIFEQEAAYAASHDSLTAKAFFSVGQLEPDWPPEIHPWAGYLTNLREFTAALASRNYHGFESTVHVFEDETHTSVVPVSVSRGLRYIYGSK